MIAGAMKMNNIAAGDTAEADGEPQKEGSGRFLTSGIKRVCGHNFLHHGGLDDCYGEQGGGGDDLKESHSIDNNVVECLLETGVELLERSRRGL